MQIQVMDGEDSGPGRGKRQESELREGIDQAPGGKWATARALAVAVAAQVGTLSLPSQTGVSNGARRKRRPEMTRVTRVHSEGSISITMISSSSDLFTGYSVEAQLRTSLFRST